MFNFKPRHLAKALEEVKEAHPAKLSDYGSRKYAKSDMGQELAAKLLATNDEQMPALLDNLNLLERSLYCGLLHDEREHLQRRVLYGLALEQSLSQTALLWAYLENNFGHELSKEAAALIASMSDAEKTLDPIQIALCDAYANETDPLSLFWQRVLERGIVEQEFGDPTLYRLGSSLQGALLGSFFFRGTHELWRAVTYRTFKFRVEQLPIPQIVLSIVRSYEIYKERGSAKGAFWLDLFLDMLGEQDSTLWTQLEEKSPETSAWFREIKIRMELSRFFEKFPDNERFKFWKGYIPQLRNARGDLNYQRLFLDFGGFGIVEFAEIGNAAYVYLAKDFQAMQEKNFRQKPSLHGAIKDRNKALTTLRHSGRWRSKFRRTISRYLNVQRRG